MSEKKCSICGKPHCAKGLCHSHYRQLPEVKQQHKEHCQRPEVKQRAKEYQQEYRQRPEVKQRQKEYGRKYQQRPEVKQRAREYLQRPEVKQRERDYQQRPEVKQRRKEYYNRPEMKQYLKLYRKVYYLEHPEVRWQYYERQRMRTSPQQFIRDFEKYIKGKRFHSEEELMQTARNFSKVTCQLGNVCDIQEILEKKAEAKGQVIVKGARR